MAIIDRYQHNLAQATKLELELALTLQKVAFDNEPDNFQGLDTTQPLPLYLEQAVVLSHNHRLRNQIRLILDNNLFVQGEPAHA